MAITTAFTKDFIVQTVSPDLPALDSGWTTRPELVPVEYEEGSGQVVGYLELELQAGLGKLPRATATAVQAIASYFAQWVRLCVRDEITPGAISYTTPSGAVQHYTQVWVGVFGPQVTRPDGATTNPGGPVTYTCSGIVSVLDQIYLDYGFEINAAGAASDPGYCPLFNAIPSRNGNTFGDRSASPATVNGLSTYVHDRNNPGNPWTAKQIVELLLHGYAQPFVPPSFFAGVGPQWVLDATSDVGCLNYIPDKIDLSGRSVLEGLVTLINPRRGCTFVASYSVIAGQPTVTIAIRSAAAAAIVGGASFTLPAATQTVSLDARGNSLISDLEIQEEETARFDGISLDGNQPLSTITLNFVTANTGSLVKGWNIATEATWDPTVDQGPLFSHTWRRFLLKSTWNGAQYPASTTEGMRNYRVWTTGASSAPDKAAYGIGGYKGTRQFLDPATGLAATAPSASTLRFEKFLGLPAETDLSASPAVTTLDMTKPLLAPLVFIKDANGVWSDITDDYSIEVEESPPAILLSGDIDDLQARLNATGTATPELLVTIGIRESAPLRVSFLDDSANWPRNPPRLVTRRMPYIEQWCTVDKTVIGVSAGALVKITGPYVTVDDTDKLRNWLAIQKPWCTSRAAKVTWFDHSLVDTATGNGTFQPGNLLSTAHRGDGPITANALIVSRRMRLRDDNWGTAYTTQRIAEDITIIEAHPRLNKIFKSNAEKDALL